MNRSKQLSRRGFGITIGAAMLGVLGSAPALASNSKRDRDDDISGYKPFFTADQFYRLSKKEIFKIRGGRRGRDIQIEGFSVSMTDYIFEMSANNWTGTRRLVRDMKKLKDPKAREARLQREIKKTKDLIRLLEESITRLSNNKGSTLAILQERGRLSHTKDYLGGVETWLKYPHEGTRK